MAIKTIAVQRGVLLGILLWMLAGCGGNAETEILVQPHGSGTITLPSGQTCREPCSYPVVIPPTQAWLSSYRTNIAAMPDPGYELISWNHPQCPPDELACSLPVETGCDYVAGPFLWSCIAWSVSYKKPEPVFLDMGTVATVSRSPFSSCVIGHDGSFQCWGFSKAGDVPELSNPRQITSHYRFACAQDDSGVVCWGGSLVPETPPRPLVEPYVLSAGYIAMCALDEGGVQCWRQDRALEVPPLEAPSQLQAGIKNHCVKDGGNAVCWEYDLNGNLVL